MAVAAAGVVLAGWVAPVASAEPVVFVDNPAIVDPHPLPFDSWNRVDNDHAVAVQFTTGTPECYGVHATVTETADTVSIDLLGGTLPEAVGRACIMIAVSGTLEVQLQGPLGDRQVLDKHR
jgi:hypothetical protein